MADAEPRIRGVIFDMDGVLCDSEPFICEAACAMFAERHRTQVHPDDFLPFVGTGEDRYLGGVAEKHGVRLTMPADKERTYAIYLEIIKGRLQPLPGVKDFIAAGRRRGLKLAVATSADRIKLDGNLAQIGVPRSSFDALVNGSEVPRKKPFPDIFLRAAAGLALPAGDCLVVEDAINGVAAGKGAGSRVLGLTTSFAAADLKAAGADWIAPHLAEVPPALLAALGLG